MSAGGHSHLETWNLLFMVFDFAGALETPWQTQCNEAMPWSGKQFGTLNCVPASWPPEAARLDFCGRFTGHMQSVLEFWVAHMISCNQCLSLDNH